MSKSKQQEKITLIVIKDKRRSFSIEISAVMLKIAFSAAILFLILLGFACLNLVYAKNVALTSVLVMQENITKDNPMQMAKFHITDDSSDAKRKFSYQIFLKAGACRENQQR